MTGEIKRQTFENGDIIGLVVRGKLNPKDNPFYISQHADCILSNGTPVGFFAPGRDNTYSGGSWSSGSALSGMDRKGSVFWGPEGYETQDRLFYVDLNNAEKENIVSTTLLLKVSHETAKRFDQFWLNLKKNPGRFDIVGDNCSTHAAEAFHYAGLISSSDMPGFDTPNNLYYDIRASIPEWYILSEVRMS